MKLIKRSIKNDIKECLKHFPSVFITGSRQVGKSTLAMDLGISNYITLDNISLFQAAKADPKGFIDLLPLPIVIDEIQRLPLLMLAIKERIDQDRLPGQFVLTGSSNLQSFKDISDSLAGRIAVFELFPFSLSEKMGKPDFNLVDFIYSGINLNPLLAPNANIYEEVMNGGYPEIQKIENVKIKYRWFSSYIATYIERDARDIGDIRNLDGFMKLYLSLIYRSGNITVKSELSKECGLDNKTLEHYLSILTNTYQIGWLKPFYKNEIKRLSKSPKVYMMDTGVLCHLLKVDSIEKLNLSEYRGMIFETFLFTELYKHNTAAKQKVEISFLRTNDGREIDFILDDGFSMIAIEVKAASSVHENDFATIKYFSKELNGKLSKGIVFYNGDHILSFGEYNHTKLYAIPLSLGSYNL